MFDLTLYPRRVIPVTIFVTTVKETATKNLRSLYDLYVLCVMNHQLRKKEFYLNVPLQNWKLRKSIHYRKN
jgi:hypothetical protein